MARANPPVGYVGPALCARCLGVVSGGDAALVGVIYDENWAPGPFGSYTGWIVHARCANVSRTVVEQGSL